MVPRDPIAIIKEKKKVWRLQVEKKLLFSYIDCKIKKRFVNFQAKKYLNNNKLRTFSSFSAYTY